MGAPFVGRKDFELDKLLDADCTRGIRKINWV